MNDFVGMLVRVVVETKGFGPVRRQATVVREPRKEQGCVFRRLKAGESVFNEKVLVPVMFRNGTTALVTGDQLVRA